ncbi:hypothetical protein LRD69_01010 [Streptomyces sp. JH14]|uniref:hypothetical protein n=1 Tax=Streptomyces sp. JH14 TaxID=2793630 RepID=UPI0023F93DC5|nr:hypothetical protein [Streptomyces sp. JH14]MDF6040770.1 hypothetical protein [Streptomyces sp. JH14]
MVRSGRGVKKLRVSRGIGTAVTPAIAATATTGRPGATGNPATVAPSRTNTSRAAEAFDAGRFRWPSVSASRQVVIHRRS